MRPARQLPRRPLSKVELRRVDIPHELADTLRERYKPQVSRWAGIAEITGKLDLETVLLDVYLQGVVDGAQVAEKFADLLKAGDA